MPGYNEIADIDVINGNMDKIDVQMKNNADSAQQSKDIVSDKYSATNTYAVGDYCIHENILYKCKTAITTGDAFDSSKWVQTTCGTEFGELNSNLTQHEITVSVSDWGQSGNIYIASIEIPEQFRNKEILSITQKANFSGDEPTWLGNWYNSSESHRILCFSSTGTPCTIRILLSFKN